MTNVDFVYGLPDATRSHTKAILGEHCLDDEGNRYCDVSRPDFKSRVRANTPAGVVKFSKR